MNCSIICVGTAVVRGSVANSNAVFVSRTLSEFGYKTIHQCIIESDSITLSEELIKSLRRTDLTVVIGGMGGDFDDITRQTVSQTLDIPLEINQTLKTKVDLYCRENSIYSADFRRVCSSMPKGAKILFNPSGIPDGCVIEASNKKIIMLPSTPTALKSIVEKPFRDYFSANHNNVFNCKLNVFGLTEKEIKLKLAELIERNNPSIIINGKTEAYSISVVAEGRNPDESKDACLHTIEQIKSILGDNVFGTNSKGLQYEIVSKLRRRKEKISIAESCTGGFLAKLITDVPGSSSIFEFGIEAYSNRIKAEALGVNTTILKNQGAVSAETALLMAQNVRSIGESKIGVSTTGVAGPASSEGKKVGTVYIAVSDGHYNIVRLIDLPSNSSRDVIRLHAALTALDLVRRFIFADSPAKLDGVFVTGDEIKVITSQPEITKTVKLTPTPTNTANPQETISDEELVSLMAEAIKNDDHDTTPYGGENVLISGTDFFATLDDEVSNKNSSYEDIIFAKAWNDRESSTEFISDVELTPNKESIFVKAKNFFLGLLHYNIDKKAEKEVVAQDESSEKTVCLWDSLVKNYRLGFILPLKSDSIKMFVGKLAILLACVAFIVAGFSVVSQKINANRHTKMIKELREKWSEQSTSEKDEEGMFTSFNFLLADNPDTIAWFRVSGTDISYPVVLSGNRTSKYWSKHDFFGHKSKFGTLNADSKVNVGVDSPQGNIVIYGNNSTDGSMFGFLKNYRDLKYLQQNPYVNLKTLYDNNNYKIFSVFIINSDKKQDNGYLYEYNALEFESESAFFSWVNEARVRSLFNVDVNLSYNDKIITLVTDTNDFKGAKLVVMAKSVTDNESYFSDTDDITVNPNPLYPQIWYDKKGGKAPFSEITSGMFGDTSSVNSIVSSIIGTFPDDESNSDINSSNTATTLSDTGISLNTSMITTSIQEGVATSSQAAVSSTSAPSTSTVTSTSSDTSSTVTSVPTSSKQETSSEGVSSAESQPEESNTDSSSVATDSSETSQNGESQN